jgi:hypothetical protein
MNNQIQNFLNYLLDSETTSEIAFIETIQKNNELYQSRHLKDWEQTVFRNLQQVHRNTHISPLNNGGNNQKSDSENSEDESPPSDDEEDNEDEKTSQNGHVNILLFDKNKFFILSSSNYF